MRFLLLAFALIALTPAAHASRKLGYGSYFPSFGVGSTSSVVYGVAAAKTFSMIAPDGAPTALVRVWTTTDAYLAVAAEPTAAASSGFPITAKTELVLEIPTGYKVSAIQMNSGGTLFVTHIPVTEDR